MPDYPSPLNPPTLRDDLPRYPPLSQVVRVTGGTVPGPSGYASSSALGPSLYVGFTQQLSTDTLLPRDREPCLVLDLTNYGLSPGYYNGRLGGSYTSLPIYEVGGSPISLPGLTPTQSAALSTLSPAQFAILANLNPCQLQVLLTALPLSQIQTVTSGVLTATQLSNLVGLLTSSQLTSLYSQLTTSQVIALTSALNSVQVWRLVSSLTSSQIQSVVANLTSSQLQTLACFPCGQITALITNLSTPQLQTITGISPLPTTIPIQRNPRSGTTYSVIPDDLGKVITTSSSLSNTVTLPDATTVGPGWFTTIQNIGTGTATINTTSAQTISGLTSLQVPPSQGVTVVSDGSNWNTTAPVAGSAKNPVNAQTGATYAVLSSDLAKLLTLSNASPVAVTLPSTSAIGIGAGWYTIAQNVGAGTATISTTGGQTINGASTLALTTGQGAYLVSDGANWSAFLGKGSSGTATFSGARVYNSVSISVSGSATLTFDSERYDTDSYHSTSVNTSRMTAPAAGYYNIAAYIPWITGAIDGNYFHVELRINGSTRVASSSVTRPPSLTSQVFYQNVQGQYLLSSGDYVEVVVSHDQASSVPASVGGDYAVEFWIEQIGGSLTAGGGSGTVTSVALTVPSELTVSGSPITGAGTLAVTWASAVTVAHGGTGLATLTAHAVLLGEGTSNIAFATIGTAGRMLLDQGAGADPSFQVLSGDGTLTSGGVLSLVNTVVRTTGVNAFSADQSLGSHKLTNVTDPASPQDAATKNYVDLAVSALAPKNECQAATVVALAAATYNNGSSGVGATLTLTVAAVLVLDGYTPALNDRLLVKNQADPKQNGLYYLSTVGVLGVTQAVLTRTLDFDQPGDGINGALVYVLNGTVNANTMWACTTTGTITFGTTSINWLQFQGATYTADESTLHLTGTVFSVKSTYSGQTSITILGTVATGVWNATVITPTYGGTGLATLTAHAVILGEGTSNVAFAAPGAGGTILISQGASADPAFTAVTGDITITSGGVTAIGAGKVTQSMVATGVTRGQIDGLILSNDASTPLTVIDIAAGTCRDDTDANNITLTAITKILNSSGSWTAGTGNNGLDTGGRATNTWYHVWAISKAAGANPDILLSTSATSPTMPSTYTLKRRIGAILTDTNGIRTFSQDGDCFTWKVRISNVAAVNPGTAAVTRTISSPLGIRCRAILDVGFAATTPATDNPAGVLITDLAVTDSAPGATDATFIAYSTVANFFIPVEVYTNTSSQVRSRLQVSTAGTTFYINAVGWFDPRGKDS